MRLDDGRGSAREARADTVIPTPTVTPSVDGASVNVEGVTPFIVANDDFYRIDTALVVPQLDTGVVVAARLGRGRAGGHDRLGHPAQAAA